MFKMLGFLKHHKRDSILAPLFKMLEATLDLIVPLITADVINVGIAGRNIPYVVSRSVLMVLLGLVGLGFSITAQYFAARAATESCAILRHDLFDRIQSLDFAQTDKIGTSTLVTRMTSDVNQVQGGLNMFLRLFLRSPFVVVGALILSFTIDVTGGLVFAVMVPVLAVAVFFIMLKTIPLYENVQTRLDRLTGIARENLTGVRIVRAFGREQDETGRFRSANDSLLDGQLGVGRISALMNPLTFVIVNLALIAVLWTGAYKVDLGALSVGSVIALVNYMNQILIELVKLANLIIQFTKASACADRINEILAMKPAMQFGTLAPDSDASDTAVEFSHVSLSYSEGAGESLSDISFKALKGQTIGIIGGTGSGKTSLVSLIPRFYDATSGEVRIFGHDVRSYSKGSLRSCVSTVMQKAVLFSGSIADNLRWGDKSADDKDLWKALDTAQASEIVRGKEGALAAVIEQEGRNLSGGQKQRLSIARSLVCRPKILILDDSSSALDFATDAALRKALRSLPGDMTVFIVSQRAGSLSHADRILVLDEGKLVGSGSHNELMRNCPVYRDICESQFKRAETA